MRTVLASVVLCGLMTIPFAASAVDDVKPIKGAPSIPTPPYGGLCKDDPKSCGSEVKLPPRHPSKPPPSTPSRVLPGQQQQTGGLGIYKRLR